MNSTIADNQAADLFNGANGTASLYNTIVGELAPATVCSKQLV